MSRATSPSTGRRYGVVMVTQELGISRATFYRRRRPRAEAPPKKRGPTTAPSDDELLSAIHEVLDDSPFIGEGHRKVWARLRHRGILTSKARVLRIMREHNLLAPHRPRRTLGPRTHDGTIITQAPNVMWGTDMTATATLKDGQAAVFILIDHYTAECIGIHASKAATRFEALEPLRQGVKEHFGAYGPRVANGLTLRHDNGSQYASHAFQDELRFLGIESSPSYVRAPEGNGCSERFIRTLKEQLLWVQTFDTVEDLRKALHQFKERYNEHWLIERLGHRTPRQARQDALPLRLAA